MHGKDMRLAVDTELIVPKVASKTADEYIEKLKPKLELAREMAKENLKESQTEMKEIYDRNVQLPKYKPGDRVWLYFPNRYGAASKKLNIKWRGPYLVIRQVGISNYILQHCATHKEITYPVNVSRMKPYYDNRDKFYTYDTQGARFSSSQAAQDTGVPSTSDEVPSTAIGTDTSRWEDCIELKAVKMIEGKIFFLVVWADNTPPSWVEEEKVGQGLKTRFFLTHTKRGTKRKDYRFM